MILYLSSYKLGNKTDYLKNWIKENNNKILLIPNSRDAKTDKKRNKEKIESNIKMLEDVGFDVTILDLKKYFDNNNKLYEDLKGFNAFCVIGGNVFVLRQAMKLSGFDRFLQENKDDKNMLYIGYSAGSSVLSKNLDGLQLVDEPLNFHSEVIYDGVGLVDYCIVPHYQSDHKESELVNDTVAYLDKNKLSYKTIRDGEVIIENLGSENK